jgi:type 1 glutamine amidotransferase
MSDPTRVYLVCGGKFHDIDFARAELLKLLRENEEIRTRVAEDYRDLDALGEADCLVTYTCDVPGTPEQQQALRTFVENGGRWLALHGTNSIMQFTAKGVDTPRDQPVLMETLGSQFMAHPPIGPFKVSVSDPSHPLVEGIDTFEVEDELYLCEYHGDLHALLETRFTGEAPGFVEHAWSEDDPRLVMYLKRVGKGEVLYLTLGHCRGKYDMRPVMDVYPQIERGAWEQPVFYELLRRGISWAAEARGA